MLDKWISKHFTSVSLDCDQRRMYNALMTLAHIVIFQLVGQQKREAIGFTFLEGLLDLSFWWTTFCGLWFVFRALVLCVPNCFYSWYDNSVPWHHHHHHHHHLWLRCRVKFHLEIWQCCTLFGDANGYIIYALT